ncbi:MFS transporter [Methylorubrum sp. SB2]|uniref:MFS transporter n=1 Tax=Methylorubrum subtropicum TaxID=3138812 RepID=UPI00313EE237
MVPIPRLIPRSGGLSGWPLVALLAAMQLTAFADRFLLTLVATPAKQALSLSDTQLGLLQGSAFVLPYALILPFLGTLADRGRQRGLLLAGLVLWSGATLACAFAESFAGLLAARLVLGIGQAAFAPTALSLLAARLDRRNLGRGVSGLTTGAALGRSLALLLGGLVLGWLTARDAPLLPGLAPWQTLFVLAVLPNFFLVPLLMTVRSTPRPVRPVSARVALAWIGRRRGAYLALAAAATASVLMSQTLGAWAPTFFVRRFGLTPAESGLWLGLTAVAAAPFGHLAGGAILDRLRRNGRTDAAPRLLALALGLAVPATALAGLSPSLTLSLAGFAALVIVLGMASPAWLSGLQLLTPRALRGRVSGLFLAVITLVGLGTGPALVGLLSDRVFGEDGLGLTLVVLFAGVGGLGALAATVARSLWTQPSRRFSRINWTKRSNR